MKKIFLFLVLVSVASATDFIVNSYTNDGTPAYFVFYDSLGNIIQENAVDVSTPWSADIMPTTDGMVVVKLFSNPSSPDLNGTPIASHTLNPAWGPFNLLWDGTTLGVSGTEPPDTAGPAFVTDDYRAAFFSGMGLMALFEVGGLTIRLLRTARASGSLEIGG